MTAPTTLQCAKCGATLPPIPGYERSTWRHCPCGHVAVAKRADDPTFSETTSGQYAGKRAAPTIQKGTRCGCVDASHAFEHGVAYYHRCTRDAVRMVTWQQAGRITDELIPQAHLDYVDEMEVPMCEPCASYHEAKARAEK